MNNLDLTRWLLKVRDALAEQDQVKRNSMLHAADRFLQEINQPSLILRRTRNRERGRTPDNSSSRSKWSNHGQGIN